ncbi:MAG TPA: fumarylacetoacetate hydrolase, partial [Gammaproteobacteria bacterium]|nr:fumarylacetoacetate hydrolase [Gammaproteobacteria bacterium]
WDLFLKVQSQRKQYLRNGDLVEASIRSADDKIDLGVQRNRVVAEAL